MGIIDKILENINSGEYKNNSRSTKKIKKALEEGIDEDINVKDIKSNRFTKSRKEEGSLDVDTSDGRQVKQRKVSSTAIDSIRYDPNTEHTYIKYKSNPSKEYSFIQTKEEFLELLRAFSKGRYVQNVMKKNNRDPKFN